MVEFIDVGKPSRALDTLYEFIKGKRLRSSNYSEKCDRDFIDEDVLSFAVFFKEILQSSEVLLQALLSPIYYLDTTGADDRTFTVGYIHASDMEAIEITKCRNAMKESAGYFHATETATKHCVRESFHLKDMAKDPRSMMTGRGLSK
ncbi:unnamed protein product [Darwinula stevensoni]|uniref:Uncharacterized protein n=1 Tax=Darwinula stevensoni TaxID=69355 RepID=A0A7R8ZZE2_9CRUS|nr:unnamed protein product [Darwinula stevensoni]CAG0882366.1 unnamed protein product [Darwinula stevensoni]